MAEITRYSLVYVAAEDRLALDAEDAEGETLRLWLTQRLCRGLVGALIPMLQKAAARRLPTQPDSTAQAWEQAAAMQDFGKVPAVRAGAESVTGLVQTVHISPAGGRVRLTFEFGDRSRVIAVTLPALRQTLAVMHRQYVAAGWPLDLWPAWIADPAAEAAAGPAN